MASHTPEERIAKRTRLEESEEESNTSARYKTIKLDMDKYAPWVGQLSPEGLVSVFEIGLKVKESAILTGRKQKRPGRCLCFTHPTG